MIFILCRRVTIQGRFLAWTIVGAAAGISAGVFAIAGHVQPSFVKLTFACLCASFGILMMAKERDFSSLSGGGPLKSQAVLRTGLIVGFIGGVIASMIGVGVEMILYTALVLSYRCDVKVAIPTAVSAMALTSIMGVGARMWAGHISGDVTMKFLAAVPLVIFGAPIGTYLVTIIPRVRMLYTISVLCILQFVITMLHLQRTRAEWIFVAVATSIVGTILYSMYRSGLHHAPGQGSEH
jgi:uncharacterized membrane protein YfcA